MANIQIHDNLASMSVDDIEKQYAKIMRE